MIKKLSIILLSLIFIIDPMQTSNYVQALPEVKTVLFEDFEGDEFDLTGYSDAEIYEFFNDPSTKKALHLKNNKNTSVYPNVAVDFSPIYIDDSVRAGAREGRNCYAEIEFDLKTYNLSQYSKHITLSFISSDGMEVKSFVINSATNNLHADSITGNSLGNIGNINNFIRFRFVLYITNENGSTINRCIKNIYVNGVSIISSPISIIKGNTIGRLGLKLTNSKSGDSANASYGAYFDNLTVIKYNSDDGLSPYAEKSLLIDKIREYSKMIYSSGNLTTIEISSVNSAFENAVALLKNSAVTQEEINNGIVQLEIDCKNAFNINETLLNENFESGSIIPDSITEPNGLMDIVEGYSSDPLINNVLRLNGSSDAFGTLSVTFDKLRITEDVDKNYSIVTEFDILADNLKSVGGNVTFRFTDSIYGINILNLFFEIGSGKVYNSDNNTGDVIAQFNKFDSWTRVRFVMDITDSDGNYINCISKIFINGKNILETPLPFAKKGQKYYSSFKIGISKKSTDKIYGLFIDNINVAANNNGMPVDKYGLAQAIRTADKALADSSYTEGEIKKIQEQKEIAVNAYYSSIINQKIVDSIASNLLYLMNVNSLEITGLEVIKPDGYVVNYITGGTLQGVHMNKRRLITQDLKLIAAVYDSEASLLNVSIAVIDKDQTEQFYVPLNLSLPEKIRSGKLKMMIWDDNLRPLSQTFDSTSLQDKSFTVTCNNFECVMSVMPVIKSDGKLYVPGKFTANLFGVDCIQDNGVFTATSDYGDSIIFNSVNAVVGDKTYPAYEQDGVVMLPFEVFEDAFGCSVLVDEIGGTIEFVSANTEIRYSAPPSNTINYTPTEYGITYNIPYSNPDAKVEVWYKDGLWRPYNNRSLYWNKAHTPNYIEGAFCGGIAGLAANRQYYFRIKITDGDDIKIYDDYKAVKTLSNQMTLSLEESLYKTEGELLLKATYENISYYIDDMTAQSCEIHYRKLGESGWKKAYNPVYDNIQWRGSIVGLKDNTEYEVRATLYDAANNVLKSKISRVKTWSNNPIISKTIRLSDIYSGNGGLILSGLKGSEDGWIKVIDDGTNIIDVQSNYTEAVLIDNCSFLILEGITVRGGYQYGINVSDNCHDIRITNCDISGWGRCGVLNSTDGAYYYDGTSVNYDAGILLKYVENVTVERCYIHDSNVRTNSWNSDSWKNVHPKGSCGIYYSAKSGVVIRYNDIIGNEEHRWNDAIEGFENGSRKGAAAKNCDIYGNMLAMGEDDGMELDGGQMNVRVYLNRIEKFLCGISTAPNLTGPSYIYRNLIVNMGTSYKNETGSAIKAGGSTDGIFGMQFFFHNTMDSDATGPTNITYGSSSEYHSVSRNNIFVTRKSGRFAFKNIYADERDSNDYDLIGGLLNVKNGDELHGMLGFPTYVNASSGDYRLFDTSIGKNAGDYIDNFCEEQKPDVGVYGGLKEDFSMPFRPIDMYADKYNVSLADGESAEIKITIGDIGNGHSYKLLKSNSVEWMEIEGLDGYAVPNSTVTFKVRANMSQCRYNEGNGFVLFRLDNGYSLVIAVHCK